MKFTNTQLAGLVVVGGLGLWYLAHKAGQAVDAAGKAINPTSQNNIFNKGWNSLDQSLGDPSWFPTGVHIADWFSGSSGASSGSNGQ